MSVKETCDILLEMCYTDNFLILDLVKIIGEYIYEIPSKCDEKFNTLDVYELIETKANNFVAATRGGKLLLWNKYLSNTPRFVKNTSYCFLAICEFDDKVLVGTTDGDILVYDMNLNFEQKLNTHKFPVISIISIDSCKFVSASSDGLIVIWNDFEEEKSIRTEFSLYSLCLFNETILNSMSEFSIICGGNKKIGILRGDNYLEFDINTSVSAICKINEELIACGCFDGYIHICQYFPVSGLKVCFQIIKTIRHENYIVYSIIKLKNGYFASSSRGSIKIWSDIWPYTCLKTLQCHDSDVLVIETHDKKFISYSPYELGIWS